MVGYFLMNTTPRPCRAEPSRRIWHSLRTQILEVASVDRLKAWFLDGNAVQAPAARDHRGGSFRTHVPVRREPKAVHIDLLDTARSRHRGKALGQPLSFRLDV